MRQRDLDHLARQARTSDEALEKLGRVLALLYLAGDMEIGRAPGASDSDGLGRSDGRFLRNRISLYS